MSLAASPFDAMGEPPSDCLFNLACKLGSVVAAEHLLRTPASAAERVTRGAAPVVFAHSCGAYVFAFHPDPFGAASLLVGDAPPASRDHERTSPLLTIESTTNTRQHLG